MDGFSEPESRFEFWRRRAGLFAGPAIGLLAYAALAGAELTPQGRALAAILIFTVTYWICEPIPLAATAMIGPLLCVVFGVEEPRKMFAPFAHPIVFLFIGSFLLAEAMRKHGLDKRLALGVLSLRGVARSPTTLLAAVGVTSALLSMWMSNTATTALILPIVLGLIRANSQLAHPRVAAPLLLMISFASTAGGLATPIGTPPNLIAIAALREHAQVDVTFAGWMGRTLPLTATLVAALVLLLRPPGHGVFANHFALSAQFRQARRQLGGVSPGERNVIAVFFLALTLWLTPGIVEIAAGQNTPALKWFQDHLPEEMVGLLAGLLLFLLPTDWRRGEFTIHWSDAAKIDWGTILLFAGGMALGAQVFDKGLAAALAALLKGWLGAPTIWTVMAVGIALSIFLSEFTSNTATANVTVPLILPLALSAGVDPIPVGIATCLAASFGFMLPVSTGPNAMVYGTGRVPLQRMIALGVAFDVVGGLLIWLLMRVTG